MSADVLEGSPVVGFVLRRSDDSEFHRHFKLQLGPKRVRIGRDPDNEVYVTLNGVSSVHAELLLAERKGKPEKGPRLVVRDLSVNGTGLKLPDGKKVVLNRGEDWVVPDGAELLLPMRASKADKQSHQERRMFVIVELDSKRQARAAALKKRQMASDGAPAEEKRKEAKSGKVVAEGEDADNAGEVASGRLDAAALAVHNRKLAAADALQRTQTALSYTAKVASNDPGEPVIQPVPCAEAEQAPAAAATSTDSAQAATAPARAAVAAQAFVEEAPVPATSSTAPAATNQHFSQLPVRHWSVIIDRRAGGALGISMSTSTLYIEKIIPDGLVDHFNVSNPSIALQKGDRVLSVNGQSAASLIVGECKKDQLLQFFLCREGLEDRVEGQAPLPRTQIPFVPALPTAAATAAAAAPAFGMALPSATGTAPAAAPAVGVARLMAPTMAPVQAPVALAPVLVAPAALAPRLVAQTTLAAAATAPHALAPMPLAPVRPLSTGGQTLDAPTATLPAKLAPITPGAPQPKGMRARPVAQTMPAQPVPGQAEGGGSQTPSLPSLRLLAARAILAASSISVDYQQRFDDMPTTLPQTESFIGSSTGLKPITPAEPVMAPTVAPQISVMAPTEPVMAPTETVMAPAEPVMAPTPPVMVPPSSPAAPVMAPVGIAPVAPSIEALAGPPQDTLALAGLPPDAPLQFMPPIMKPPPPAQPQVVSSQAPLQLAPSQPQAVLSQFVTPSLKPPPPPPPPRRAPPGSSPRRSGSSEEQPQPTENDPPRSELTAAAVAKSQIAPEIAAAKLTAVAVAKSQVAPQIAAAKLAESGSRADDRQAADDDAARSAAARKAVGDDASSESRTRSVSVTPEERRRREKSRSRNRSRSSRRFSSAWKRHQTRRPRSWSRDSDRSRQHHRRERSRRSRSGSKQRDKPRRHEHAAHSQRRSRSRTGKNGRQPQLSGGNLVPIGKFPRPTCPSMPSVQGDWRPPKQLTLHSKMPGVPGPPPLPPPLPPPSHMLGPIGMMAHAPMPPHWNQHAVMGSWTSPPQGKIHDGRQASGQSAAGDLDLSDL